LSLFCHPATPGRVPLPESTTLAFHRRPPITLSATDRQRRAAILAVPTRPQTPVGRARILRTRGGRPATVHGIRKRQGPKPHPTTTVTVSNDPRFAITVHDVVGLARTPPDPAGVLAVDMTTPILTGAGGHPHAR